MTETEMKFKVCQALLREVGDGLSRFFDMELSHEAIGKLRQLISKTQKQLIDVDSSLIDIGAEFPVE